MAKRDFVNENQRRVKVAVCANILRRRDRDGEVAISIETMDSMGELFCTRMEAEQLRDALTEYLS